MSRTDIKNSVSVASTIAPGDYDATQTGTGVDLANADSAAVIFAVGAVANNDFTFAIQESDDNASFTPVSADDLDGTVPAAPVASAVTVVGYRGIKRYLRVVATDGGAGDAVFGVSVLTGKRRVQPAG